jgi:hypothetical protein
VGASPSPPPAPCQPSRCALGGMLNAAGQGKTNARTGAPQGALPACLAALAAAISNCPRPDAQHQLDDVLPEKAAVQPSTVAIQVHRREDLVVGPGGHLISLMALQNATNNYQPGIIMAHQKREVLKLAGVLTFCRASRRRQLLSWAMIASARTLRSTSRPWCR